MDGGAAVSTAEVEVGIAAYVAVAVVDWEAYDACRRVCGAPAGQPCRSMYERIHNGRPTGPLTELPHAHGTRKRLRGR